MFKIDTMHPIGLRTFPTEEEAQRAADMFDVPRGRVRPVTERSDRLADVVPIGAR